MAKEITPSQTKRAEAFALWMKAPMPMITLFKTLDVTEKEDINSMLYCAGASAKQLQKQRNFTYFL